MQRNRTVAVLPRLDRVRERAADDLIPLAVLAPSRSEGGELAQVGRHPGGRLDGLVLKLGLAARLVHDPDVVLAQNAATGQQLLEHARKRLELGPCDDPLCVRDQPIPLGPVVPQFVYVPGELAFVAQRTRG